MYHYILCIGITYKFPYKEFLYSEITAVVYKLVQPLKFKSHKLYLAFKMFIASKSHRGLIVSLHSVYMIDSSFRSGSRVWAMSIAKLTNSIM
jgi:hypothetical protein